MSALKSLRDAFISEMMQGSLVLHKTGRLAGQINRLESVRPFYFKSKKSNGRYQPSNADGKEPIAANMADRLSVRTWEALDADPSVKPLLISTDGSVAKAPFSGQTCGSEFEKLVMQFISKALAQLQYLRPGDYQVRKGSALKSYTQYRHLEDFVRVLDHVPVSEVELRRRLAAALSSYAVAPDVVITRRPPTRVRVEQEWKAAWGVTTDTLLDDTIATRTPFILDNQPCPADYLHAIVSAKWTLRSDRAQNARTEGAFATRERRGHSPHVVVVTGESKPSRIRSLTEGPDVDCVYHFSLGDLVEAVKHGSGEEQEKLEELLAMNRLRDLTDLPFDLVV